jgi:hypothetical protein
MCYKVQGQYKEDEYSTRGRRIRRKIRCEVRGQKQKNEYSTGVVEYTSVFLTTSMLVMQNQRGA